MNRILAYPPTWLAAVVLLILETALMLWFQPGLVMTVLLAVVGLACLSLWVIMLLRSPAFLMDTSRKELEKRLSGCDSDFCQVALDCWTAAERIKQEFRSRGFTGDIDEALANLGRLTDTHVALRSRYETFGDVEQKLEMRRRIQEQIKHAELTRESLLRLGGNIVLLEANSINRQEINAELRAINDGLEGAIREMEEMHQ
jgi:hypothetical protein